MAELLNGVRCLSTNCDIIPNVMPSICVLHCFKPITMAMIMMIVILISTNNLLDFFSTLKGSKSNQARKFSKI